MGEDTAKEKVVQMVDTAIGELAARGLFCPPGSSRTTYLRACWLLSKFQQAVQQAERAGEIVNYPYIVEMVQFLKTNLKWLHENHNPPRRNR